MRHKVVLYNPQAVFYTMPLGLLAVGSCLDPERYDVRIIDARLEDDPEAAVLAEIDDAVCLGMSVLTGRPIADALGILRAAKARRPDLPTVWGGWHPSLFPTQCLDEPCLDYTVKGQGETSFRELVERLVDGQAADGISGVGFRQNGHVVFTDSAGLEDMDTFPPPDFGLIPVAKYFSLKGRRQLDYITSTGCLFRCAFCADPFVYNRGWSAVSPCRLADDIESLWQQYNFTDLNFQDETFFTYAHRVAEISEEFLRRDMQFTWAATMRADQGVRLPEEIFDLCIRSGLRRVLIGVESGSPAVLERIMKDTTVDQVIAAAEMCAHHGVAVIFSFIVGFPGEGNDEVQETLDLVKRLRAMSSRFETPIFYYKPYPGSRLAQEVTADIPRTLDGWADFDYVAGAAGPWVSPQIYKLVERFKFYNRFAWGPQTAWRVPLQMIARWRCQRDWYRMPLEKLVVECVKPSPRLS